MMQRLVSRHHAASAPPKVEVPDVPMAGGRRPSPASLSHSNPVAAVAARSRPVEGAARSNLVHHREIRSIPE